MRRRDRGKRRKFYLILTLVLAPLLVIVGCMGTLTARQARLSGAVAVVSEGAAMQRFLASPGEAYVQAYMRFGPELADDVIIALDQEWVEGVSKPRHVKGGDWMAFVGVQRAGAVWVAAGTEAQLKGTPSKDRNWKIIDLRTRLKPDTWYKLRIEADFGARRFKSFTIEGDGLARTLDLSAHLLDYPNYMPFSDATMTYFVVAMRSAAMMKTAGKPVVYFDDVEAGVKLDGAWQRVYADGFESAKPVTRQPVTLPVINLSGYEQGRWYLERDESIVTIEKVPFARSGAAVGVADARLD